MLIRTICMKQVNVIKKNGELELFNKNKVINSLKNSGANKKTIERIMNLLERKLYDGIPTEKIFRFVFKKLNKDKPNIGTRYNLKKGIMEMSLGGGFVFEKFMSRVFQKIGYQTNLNQIVKGKNITHEIDIIATKKNKKSMIECKHFSKPFLGISIQTALYVYARYLDTSQHFQQAFLVTNTKFSSQVIHYSKGVGLKLIGWKYPKDSSLEKLIEKEKIYPITILPLSNFRIRRYLEKEILTFQDLLERGKPSKKIRKIIESML